MNKNDPFNEIDPFGLPPVPAAANAPPEMTVSELSQRLRKTVEEQFSYVRVRGELSRITLAKSGHLYTDLKDAEAVLNSICWKGTVGRLAVKPEEGMDVIVTGRLTTYPGRSNYQLIIETMELAGQGALLKMLEDRKKKLAAEGLFDARRKRPLPYLPRLIGVVTSPTGAVIRDILHRLEDRFPSHVLVWAVQVQGQDAARQVSAAIRGFNALDGALRPDLIIVARGGGSLEDLMPFNDEDVVRATAASAIPLISAVGHETDTTLIDFASDLRAPTPTAAAEMAVPVRRDLLAFVRDCADRMRDSTERRLEEKHLRVTALARGLGDPQRKLENAAQRLDHLQSRIDAGLRKGMERRARTLRELELNLPHPRHALQRLSQHLALHGDKLGRALPQGMALRNSRLREVAARMMPQHVTRRTEDMARSLGRGEERLLEGARRAIEQRAQKVERASALLESLSFTKVLERGYAVVMDKNGALVSSAGQAPAEMTIRFRDGTVEAQKK